MILMAKAGHDVDLTPRIVGIGGPGAKAAFALRKLAPDGSESPILPSSPGVFSVPAQTAGTKAVVRVDTLPTFLGVSSADVLIDATQGATALHDAFPVGGHPLDWLYDVTVANVLFSGPLTIHFN